MSDEIIDKSIKSSKINIDDIAQICDKKGFIYIDSYMYKGRTYVDYICKRHEDKGVRSVSLKSIKGANGCFYCGREVLASKKRKDGEVVYQFFLDKNLTPLFKPEEYVNRIQELSYICNLHKDEGVQYTNYANLQKGLTCKLCAIKRKKIIHLKSHEQFCKDLDMVWDNEYIPLQQYNGSHKKILFKHNIEQCGFEWMTPPVSLLTGSGCPKCSGRYINTDIFKENIYKLVKNDYTVESEYISSTEDILLKHKKCGKSFLIKPEIFIAGTRCPFCKETKGETKIRIYLESKNFIFRPQYSFKDCKYKKRLQFDFVVFNEDKKVRFIVEYDGEQHYEKVNFSRDDKINEQKFKNTQIRDKIKNKYCDENNILLIRIPYWEYDNIENILQEKILA